MSFGGGGSDGSGGASTWDELSNKPDYLDRIATDATFYLKGDGTNVGDIKAEVSSGSIQYIELKSQTPDVWETATITDINLANHGSLNDRLDALANAREFQGDIDGTGVLSQLDDAVNGYWWIVKVAGTLSGEALAINDMVICHTDVTGTPTDLSSFSHISSTMNQMIGATTTTDGVMGAVPKPLAGQEDKVFYGNGNWQDLPEADDTTTGIIKLDKDLGGTSASPKVVGIQGVEIDNTAPEADQALVYDGAGDKYVPKHVAFMDENGNLIINGGLNETRSIFFQEVGISRFAIEYDGSGASPNNLLKIKASPANAGTLSNDAITINQEGKVVLDKILKVTGGIVSPDGTNKVEVTDEKTKITGGLEITGNVKKGYGQATFSGTCVDNTNLPMSTEKCSDGTYVTFDITNSTFTLKAGKTYKVAVCVGALSFAAITDNLAFRITKADSTTMLGTSGRIYPLGSTELRSNQPTATAIVSPTIDTAYRVYALTVEGTVTVSHYYSGVTITEL